MENAAEVWRSGFRKKPSCGGKRIGKANSPNALGNGTVVKAPQVAFGEARRLLS